MHVHPHRILHFHTHTHLHAYFDLGSARPDTLPRPPLPLINRYLERAAGASGRIVYPI